GRGGWPMSVFLTPELKPFFGGTYWPPTDKLGMPGFERVLAAVIDAWQNRRDAALSQAEQLIEHLQSIGREEGGTGGLRRDLVDVAEAQLKRSFDFNNGGFGTAPKFPHPMDVQLLLRQWRRHKDDGRGVQLLEMVTRTLDKMAAGGIYDHLGGGFARYSVDERWLVPHFEKMLYDNALLVGAYLDAYLATNGRVGPAASAAPAHLNPLESGDNSGGPALAEASLSHPTSYESVVRQTCDYILLDMTDESGGFHSTEDADSEGEEGKFYVWTPKEIEAALGHDAAVRFCYVYDVSDHGNFEHGKSILNLPKSVEQCAALHQLDAAALKQELAESRDKLLAARNERVRPGKDDKILVSWNGLMIDSLARAGVILSEPRYVEAAAKAATFILEKMTRQDGRLLHTYRNGQARLDAYLDDYACLISALVTLYESTFDEAWIDHAVRLADIMLARFADTDHGGFFFTADDHEQLIARNKDLHDASVPSGNAMAATALVRLGKLTGKQDFIEAAQDALHAGLPVMERSPTAAGQLLIALDMFLGPMPEIVILGSHDAAQAALQTVHNTYLPNRVIAFRPAGDSGYRSPHLGPLFEGKTPGKVEPTLYLCENFACQAPAMGPEAVQQRLAELA
ncbi:MAG: thioredoxin domain-containing protein, partial [Pirellulaceae bacterium]